MSVKIRGITRLKLTLLLGILARLCVKIKGSFYLSRRNFIKLDSIIYLPFFCQNKDSENDTFD